MRCSRFPSFSKPISIGSTRPSCSAKPQIAAARPDSGRADQTFARLGGGGFDLIAPSDMPRARRLGTTILSICPEGKSLPIRDGIYLAVPLDSYRDGSSSGRSVTGLPRLCFGGARTLWRMEWLLILDDGRRFSALALWLWARRPLAAGSARAATAESVIPQGASAL